MEEVINVTEPYYKIFMFYLDIEVRRIWGDKSKELQAAILRTLILWGILCVLQNDFGPIQDHMKIVLLDLLGVIFLANPLILLVFASAKAVRSIHIDLVARCLRLRQFEDAAASIKDTTSCVETLDGFKRSIFKLATDHTMMPQDQSVALGDLDKNTIEPFLKRSFDASVISGYRNIIPSNTWPDNNLFKVPQGVHAEWAMATDYNRRMASAKYSFIQNLVNTGMFPKFLGDKSQLIMLLDQ